MNESGRERIEVRAEALTLPSLRDGCPSPLEGEG
jgi:hypothetical protein